MQHDGDGAPLEVRRAEAPLDRRRHQAAAERLGEVQEVAGRGDASVKAVAQFALGALYKKSGEIQKAIDIYKQLYDSGGYSKAAVAYELATLYEKNNQVDQATSLYQRLVSDFPDSPFRQNADDALKRLGVTTPPPKPS